MLNFWLGIPAGIIFYRAHARWIYFLLGGLKDNGKADLTLGAIQKGRHRQIGNFWPSLPPLSPFVTKFGYLPSLPCHRPNGDKLFSVDMMFKRDLRSHNGVIEVYGVLKVDDKFL